MNNGSSKKRSMARYERWRPFDREWPSGPKTEQDIAEYKAETLKINARKRAHIDYLRSEGYVLPGQKDLPYAVDRVLLAIALYKDGYSHRGIAKIVDRSEHWVGEALAEYHNPSLAENQLCAAPEEDREKVDMIRRYFAWQLTDWTTPNPIPSELWDESNPEHGAFWNLADRVQLSQLPDGSSCRPYLGTGEVDKPIRDAPGPHRPMPEGLAYRPRCGRGPRRPRPT